MMDSSDTGVENNFEEVAHQQAAKKPFPGVSDQTLRYSSLGLSIVFLLPALGIVIYAFETSRMVLAVTTTTILIVVWVAYYLILNGIMKRRGQM